jgi:HPt (histidine-containing phosphotransfer) domain-containing protein
MDTPGVTPRPIYSIYENDECFGDLVELFVEEMPRRVQLLLAQASPDQWPQLRRTAHQIKGSAGSYGFGLLTELAAELETAILGGERRAIERRLADLVDACNRVRYGDPSSPPPPASDAP